MFDVTKPVRTRDGCDARIVCTDKVGPRPILALVRTGINEAPMCFFEDGRRFLDHDDPRDLVNVEAVSNVIAFPARTPPSARRSRPLSSAQTARIFAEPPTITGSLSRSRRDPLPRHSAHAPKRASQARWEALLRLVREPARRGLVPSSRPVCSLGQWRISDL